MSLAPAPAIIRIDIVPQLADLNRRGFLTGAAALGALLAAGCATAEVATDGTVQTRDFYGLVEVPRDPQRVVVLDQQVLGTLLAIGFPVERIAGWARYADSVEPFSYLSDLANLETIPVLDGTFADPNIEAIVAAEPDLILMLAGDDGDFYRPIFEKLRSTGVSVFGVTNGRTLEQNMALLADVGNAVSRADEARDLRAAFEARLADLKQRIASLDPVPSAAFMRVTSDPSIWNQRSPLLAELEVPNSLGDELWVEVSPENLTLFTEDVLFVSDGDDPAAIRAHIEQNPLWNMLPAAQNNRVVWVPDTLWGASYSLPAMQAQLDTIETALLG